MQHARRQQCNTERNIGRVKTQQAAGQREAKLIVAGLATFFVLRRLVFCSRALSDSEV